MTHWVQETGPERSTRFKELIDPLAAMLRALDDDARGGAAKQFAQLPLVVRRRYRALASHVLNAVGPAIERQVRRDDR